MERSTGYSQPATLALYQHTSFFRKNVPCTGDSRFRVGRLRLWIIIDGEMPKGAPGSSASHKRRATCPNRQAYRTSAINRAGGLGVEKQLTIINALRAPDSEKLSYAQLGGPAALHVFARPPTAAPSLVRVDNAKTLRQSHRPCPLVDVKFDENTPHIGLHGLRRNRKGTCNFLVGVPLSHQIYDISLALT